MVGHGPTCVDVVVGWMMRRRAKRNEKEAHEQLKSKELIIMDLTKKCTDLNNKLKEYSALYDIVKNDRNKHVNQIQVRLGGQGGLRQAGMGADDAACVLVVRR